MIYRSTITVKSDQTFLFLDLILYFSLIPLFSSTFLLPPSLTPSPPTPPPLCPSPPTPTPFLIRSSPRSLIPSTPLLLLLPHSHICFPSSPLRPSLLLLLLLPLHLLVVHSLRTRSYTWKLEIKH